jgi:hypothetical protein
MPLTPMAESELDLTLPWRKRYRRSPLRVMGGGGVDADLTLLALTNSAAPCSGPS